MAAVHFVTDDNPPSPQPDDVGGRRAVSFQDEQAPSNRSLMSAPPAPPHEHRRTSLIHEQIRHSLDDGNLYDDTGDDDGVVARRRDQFLAFGGVSKRYANRQIRRERKEQIIQRRGWSGYTPTSVWTLDSGAGGERFSIAEEEDGIEASEGTSLLMGGSGSSSSKGTRHLSSATIQSMEDNPWEALKEMFLDNKINVLFVFLPLAYWSHASKWSDGSIFILNFVAMIPLASMLGVFTEELASHTNDVIGGLINATFGNAVELVVAIQALLQNDFQVVQASLIGSVFSNLLLVLGMCFLCGGIVHSEQKFIAQGAVASIALLAFNGLTLLLPMFFGDDSSTTLTEEGGGDGGDVELTLSRIGAVCLILMYVQLLFFQMYTHVHLFQGDGEEVALIPFSWALIGLILITAIVTILSEWLVSSIDGFCEEFNIGRSFVGVIILPVVGNAVEHISAVSVAMKNKMDLALGGE